MDKTYHTSIFLFHRDLRLEDNTGLIEALKHSKQVIPVFIFDTWQVRNNPHKSENAIAFMIESLQDLDQALKKKNSSLYCFTGQTTKIIQSLLKQVDAIYSNADYTPFATKRDSAIAKLCNQLNKPFHTFHDVLLKAPGTILKEDGGPYTVFTPFYKKALQTPIDLPKRNKYTNYSQNTIAGSKSIDEISIPITHNKFKLIKGGRSQAKKLLKRLKTLTDYTKLRDFPAIKGTSFLSAHHKFGTVSVREVAHVAKRDMGVRAETFIRELYWRDFMTHIGYHFPHVFAGAFKVKYNQIKWSRSTKNFEIWCQGRTGFPIVDAGMRQLNTTGYMHNRVRMIVASFLTKDLQISWQWGEKYFASKLTDYDPCVNNGSWQWAASTGCDAQPYFRIFNPWLQQGKFDKDAKYIKKWLPELANLSAKEIHNLNKSFPNDIDYPKPMVDHAQARVKTLDMFNTLK